MLVDKVHAGALIRHPCCLSHTEQEPDNLSGCQIDHVWKKLDVCCMQAPYDIQVVGPSYISLLEIANAEILGNVTNGSMDLRITEAYQDLEPDFGNMVNVTLTLATSSQVSSCHHLIVDD